MNLECPIITAQGVIKMLRTERPAKEGPARRIIDKAITHFEAGVATLEVLQAVPEKTGKDDDRGT